MKKVILNDTFDAQIWAQEWIKAIEEKPEIPTDEGTMLAWFANAIMAGYDHAYREMKNKNRWRDPAKELPPPVGNGVASEEVLTFSTFKDLATGEPRKHFKQMYCTYYDNGASGFAWPVLAWRYLPDGPEWLGELGDE